MTGTTAGLANPRALALAIGLLAAVPFLPSLGGGFVFDDQLQIVENDQLLGLRNLPRFFVTDVWAAAGIPYSAYYRPLMYTTYALEVAVAGPVPWIFRVTNLVLHVLVSISLLFLMRRVGAPLAAAAVAGALFAVHPMHAEAVAWPAARPDLLMALFSLLAAIVWLGSARAEGPTRGRFLAVGALVMLSLLSKESGLLAPVLIGAVILMRSPRDTGWARIQDALGNALPFVALVAVFLGIRGLVIQVPGSPPLVGDDPLRFPFHDWPTAILHVLAIAGRYLGTMLAPLEASFFRVPSWEHVAWGLALLPLGFAAVAASPWSRAATWLAFAFVAIGAQSLGIPSAGYLSHRYSYLPSIGVCAALGELAAMAWFRAAASAPRRRMGLVVVAAVVALWTALLIPRTLEWASEEQLWRAAFPRDPESPAVMINYGYLLVDEGRGDEALTLFRRLEEVEPGGWASPHGEGNVLVALGRIHEAIPRFRLAIERAPMIPQLHQSLAAAYEHLGDYATARKVYSDALELFPDSALAQGLVGTVLLREGSAEEALERIDEALRIRPDRPELLLNRVIVLAQLGRVDEAIAASEAMIDDPVLAPEAHHNLGILYDRYRPDPERALLHYVDALRMAPSRSNAAQVRQRIAALRAELADESR